jgi:hypothetical protein
MNKAGGANPYTKRLRDIFSAKHLFWLMSNSRIYLQELTVAQPIRKMSSFFFNPKFHYIEQGDSDSYPDIILLYYQF